MCAFLAAGALSLVAQDGDSAKDDHAHHVQIKSFAVGPDETLSYPANLSNLPDEHTTFIPLHWANEYLVFGASKVSSGGTGGAVVLATTDLKHFDFATAWGYNQQVMSPPLPIDKCDPKYNTEFDENYAAPGSVVQDPTRPPGNLMMFYEAENHCPGGNVDHSFYATTGFVRSSDNGKTWPDPLDSEFGGPDRHPVLKGPDPEPAVAHQPMGDAIPSAFVDRNESNENYVYVTYGYHVGVAGADDGFVRVARAKLGERGEDGEDGQLKFKKWFHGEFREPGIGGLDTGVLPSLGCAGMQRHSEISHNDDLGLYVMIYVCVGPAKNAAWYYSTATSLDLQDWTTPQMILNSDGKITDACGVDGTGSSFDGWYPSSMSPGFAAGHTGLTGRVFFQNGCDTGARVFTSRTFTITTGP
jgi:hypothetical protein